VAKQLGAARLLIAIYGVFAISATARAGYQLVFEFDQAPIAYSLSALAALIYLFATYLLVSNRFRKYAKYAIWFELIGVVVVGLLSLLVPAIFQHPSVWSQFGAGYGYIPLVLPVIGILWLRKTNA
jgi:hypothetical protein